MGAPLAWSRKPKLSKYATRPLRATSTTAPGISPLSAPALSTWPRRSSPSEDSPTCSGRADGSGSAPSAAVIGTRAPRTARAASRFMAGRLLVAEGLDGIEAGRPERGIDAEAQADARGDSDRQDD